jgi:hydrogenase maturation protease
MPTNLIIGYGNPLRGDDAFGWLAARRLQELIEDPAIKIMALQQLTPELMEPLSQVRRAIFIDAAAAGDPGKLTVASLEAAPGGASAFTHFATPAALLAGAGSLYGARPEGFLITVVGMDFSMGAELSAPVRQALESLDASKIIELLGRNPSLPL